MSNSDWGKIVFDHLRGPECIADLYRVKFTRADSPMVFIRYYDTLEDIAELIKAAETLGGIDIQSVQMFQNAGKIHG